MKSLPTVNENHTKHLMNDSLIERVIEYNVIFEPGD